MTEPRTTRTRRAVDIQQVSAGNDQLGVTVHSTTDHPVSAWIGPIQTVSNSEAGFELVYQGCATLLVEPLRLAPGERWSLKIVQETQVAAERFPSDADGAAPATVPAHGPAAGADARAVATGGAALAG